VVDVVLELYGAGSEPIPESLVDLVGRPAA
jgi:hypothetical protein